MSRDVQVIGVPYGHGGVGQGCKLGPEAVRQAGLEDHVYPEDSSERRYVESHEDSGDLAVENLDEETERNFIPEPGRYDLDGFVEELSEAAIVDGNDGCAKHLDEIVRLWDEVALGVRESIEAGNLPLVVGGDHTIATGTIRGAARDADENIGIIWLDAHADYNTPLSSPSGNVHGMPLAAALGRGPFAGRPWAEADVREASVALVGLREVDHDLPDWVADHDGIEESAVETEAEAIAESEVTATTMADVDERGVDEVIQAAIDVATDGVDGVHVSVDLDWLDSSVVSGVGTPVDQGVTLREARRAMEIIAERNAAEDFVRSIEFVEVNPLVDEDGNGTAEIAAKLAGSTFGEQFLHE